MSGAPKDDVEGPGDSHVNGKSLQGRDAGGVGRRRVRAAEVLCPAAVSAPKM
jgi:hypothetical protein